MSKVQGEEILGGVSSLDALFGTIPSLEIQVHTGKLPIMIGLASKLVD